MYQWTRAITRLTARFMCGLMSDLVICKFRKSMVTHDTECPHWDQVSLKNININQLTPVCFQVKPLLQVTNNEEKLSVKDQELKQVQDKFEKTQQEYTELEGKQKQLIEEKNILSEQLQAEAEMCAEAEEVREKTHCILYC